MHENLQHLILSWVIQTGNTDALQHLKKAYFKDPIYQDIIHTLISHEKAYGSIPSLKVLMHYGKDQELWKDVLSSLVLPSDDEAYVKKEFNKFVKKEEFKLMLNKHLPKLQDGHDIYDMLIDDMEKVAAINVGGSDLLGKFVEDEEININRIVGYPTFLPALNAMTSAGGFYSPQLIIFLGGPKTFKTGLLINLAVEYALDGLNVFYADFENGADELLVRFQQSLCRCTEEELETPEFRKEYKIRKKAIKTAGGGIYLRSFYARIDSMKTIEKEIDLLIRAEEFIPDVIFIDYLDIVGTSDPYVHERRLIIQDNYLRAVSLNKKYNCFTFSISRVKASAFDKSSHSVGDMGEDSEKVYNAHAVFSYIRDENDRRANIARISSLVQRKGESYGRDDCWVEIDETRQSMEEVEPGLV